jgi:riboflavin synthase
MFTGLVQAVGLVTEARPTDRGVSITIDPASWARAHKAGDSVCVAGVCLTVTSDAPAGAPLAFDAVRETLDKTTLAYLRPGARVNLEASLRADSLLGGHFVQGHVDAPGAVEHVQDDPRDWRVRIRPPGELMDYIAPKGSITVDGVSLTIAAAAGDTFEVALIPTTLRDTTLSSLRAGDACNIECDMLAKTVVHFLKRREG